MSMEITCNNILHDLFSALMPTVLIVLVTIVLWKAMNLLWIKPNKIERLLRQQGLKGSPYKPLVGDALKLLKLIRKPVSPLTDFPDATVPGVNSFFRDNIQKYGKICFTWIGPSPCLIIAAPELVKEILAKYEDFQKPNHPFNRLLMVGLFGLESETWAKHRKIINPAFNLDKLKNMFDGMYISCRIMTSAWEEKLSEEGSTELDVWPFVEKLSGDVISRAAFDSSYEEGRKIFDLLKEHVSLLMRSKVSNYIPGWRFLPTKVNVRVKQICKEVEGLLMEVIGAREKELKATGCNKDDLLGILMESNMKVIKEHGNEKGRGLTTKDVVEECKLFYLAGQETTSSLLVWTLITLSKHKVWQERARSEVLQVFGKDQKPDFERLSRLKVVTMILYEVLRLYSPVYAIMRKVYRDVKLKNWWIPNGTEVILPIHIIHQDNDLWGEDVQEFNPYRFSEGVSKATTKQGAFLPFSAGPRTCIGQNFSILEAKVALTVILQRFSLDLSPTYSHAPCADFTLRPQSNANLILHKLKCGNLDVSV